MVPTFHSFHQDAGKEEAKRNATQPKVNGGGRNGEATSNHDAVKEVPKRLVSLELKFGKQ